MKVELIDNPEDPPFFWEIAITAETVAENILLGQGDPVVMLDMDEEGNTVLRIYPMPLIEGVMSGPGCENN